jgi:hypothetical protein
MIEAWFEGWDMTGDGSAVNVPVLMPNDEIREIAGLVGMDDSDLFCIDIPSGFTRHTTIKCLIPTQSLRYLFNEHLQTDTVTAVGIKFFWRDKNVSISDADQSRNLMRVWLLPPRPIFQNATKYANDSSSTQVGVVALTAVDRRYFWNSASAEKDYYLRKYTHDGRWVSFQRGEDTPIYAANSLIRQLSADITGDESKIDLHWFEVVTNADPVLQQRAWNIYFGGAVNAAMGLDLLLSLLGFVLVPVQAISDWVYIALRIGGLLDGTSPTVYPESVVKCAEFIDYYQNAVAGGFVPSSDVSLVTASTHPLYRYWNGQFDDQYQRWCVANNWDRYTLVQFPIRSTEGNTLYSNTDEEVAHTGGSFYVLPSTFFEEKLVASIASGSGRSDSFKRYRALRESRPMLRSPNSTDRLDTPSVPAWDYAAYAAMATELLRKRIREVQYGTVALGGWVLSMEPYLRLTHLRYTIAIRSGQVVPITLVTNDESDWLLGPDGLHTTDPRQVFVGKGLAKVQRHCSGIVEIDVAPPNCRVFPARITGATRVSDSGNGYWQWEYQWEEVERDPDTVQPVGVNMDGYERSWSKIDDTPLTAVNFAEAGNVYLGLHNSGNKIAPGVLQSEYSAAWIEPAPISVGTIVMMCEHFPTGNVAGKAEGDYPNAFHYWFSMPNAVKVTCT